MIIFTRNSFPAILFSFCFVSIPAIAEDNATMREIPQNTTNNTRTSAVQYHPEYKKLVDELKYLQARQATADDVSAARGRQAVAAAANRLNQYLASGRPTVLSGGSQSSGNVNNNALQSTDTDDINNTIDTTNSMQKEAAYELYVQAYNKLTSLMSTGQGGTPAGQAAYIEYKKAKDVYEAALQ